MTAQSPITFDLDTAPVTVTEVALTVRDLDRVRSFYEDMIGLRVHDENASGVLLGAERPFLRLDRDPEAALAEPTAPGLFHTAFLLPSRQDLADWINHAAARGLRLQGASDHVVSEAFYFADPEGNGIEVYADRPVNAWTDDQGQLAMTTKRLDPSTFPSAKAWTGAPGDTRIGHVHLQTADIPDAELFWTDLGMDVMARYPGGSFFGAGGYHHQIAANTWKSAGRPVQATPKTGLGSITLSVDPTIAPSRRVRIAPSGVTVILEPKGSAPC